MKNREYIGLCSFASVIWKFSHPASFLLNTTPVRAYRFPQRKAEWSPASRCRFQLPGSRRGRLCCRRVSRAAITGHGLHDDPSLCEYWIPVAGQCC